MRRHAIAALLLALLAGAPGCDASLSRLIVEPSAGNELLGLGMAPGGADMEQFRRVVREIFAAAVLDVPAPDGATLRVMVFEPGDYGLDWSAERGEDGFRFRFGFDTDSLERSEGAEAAGTVVFLHGLYAEGTQLLPQALDFAERGYRSVLVDLRAHGASGGRYVTFGVREREDLRAVLERLRHRGDLSPPVILYGTSLGGAVAIQGVATGVPADRIVAVAAFADAREAVIRGGRQMLPEWLRFLVSRERVAAAADRAEGLAGFDFEEAVTAELAPRVRVPVLLIHAREDEIVPFDHAGRLHAQLPCSQLRAVDGHGHVSLMMDPGVTVESVVEWLGDDPACASGDSGPGRSGDRRSRPREHPRPMPSAWRPSLPDTRRSAIGQGNTSAAPARSTASRGFGLTPRNACSVITGWPTITSSCTCRRL